MHQIYQPLQQSSSSKLEAEKPQKKKPIQSSNPFFQHGDLWSTNLPCPSRKKRGAKKTSPRLTGRFFFGGHIPASPMPFGMKVLMRFMYLGWELGRWGEFWSIFFRQKKPWGETGFFQRKTLGSVIMVFELRVNFSWIIHPPMSHSLLILWVWILYSWYSYVCTIHFYAGHTPSFMVHN